MKRHLFAFCLAAIASAASAQTVRVPDISDANATSSSQPSGVPAYPMVAPPPVAPLSTVNPRLTAKDKKGIELSRPWLGASSLPATGLEGAVQYEFGATLPAIVCRPLFICDVQLQAGEIINNIDIGDKIRWKVSPASSGSGADGVTHVLIKPTDANLKTNMVITTTRRTYLLSLTSSPKDWMPRIAFTYPEEQDAAWSQFVANQKAAAAVEAAKLQDQRRATILPTGQPISKLNFGFKIIGDKPDWKPLRVYSDGAKTFIQFPAALKSGEAPVLIGIGDDDKSEIINYRIDGDRYIVDQVIHHVALVSGVGRRQVKVDIRQEGKE